MVFSSQIFLFYFLPLALAVYYFAPRRAKNGVLAVLSYLFYGWGTPILIGLILLSTAVDYGCGLAIGSARRDHGRGLAATAASGGRAALVISICTNLGLLAFFKYFTFATDSYDGLMSALGLAHLRLDVWFRVALPLGISFYTFQSMSYTIDVYRGRVQPIRRFVDFAAYVAMFPQLVAGPIVRFREVDRQLLQRHHTPQKIARGLALLALGLAKKVLVANPMGRAADIAFGAASIAAPEAWFGLLAYSFQIYFDFSGYSDMALGLGLMFGFVFPKNFDSPYLARSITDFWGRWHLSLSHWLRDYLYVPLGGNRRGQTRTYFNLGAVMLLGGFWHGASATFLVWGALHGAALILERIRGKRSLYQRLPVWARVTVTFAVVSIGWVFFRAASLPDAFRYIGALFGAPASESAALLAGMLYQPFYLVVMAAAALVVWRMPQSTTFAVRLNWAKVAAIYALFAFAVVALATQTFNPFIYFIF